ncbi:hypothetical protein LOK49_LG01G01631 [Camellia lanceoleosa]|uniref:Uncharacterized protein n=1 Tax=Camellia lanceoleosa TaxID=1840588 RepID=A0ACC0J470_9ERIC|nr:hypothetical protein LOK49_LG01G01631 [Camellia lanceoleosa]
MPSLPSSTLSISYSATVIYSADLLLYHRHRHCHRYCRSHICRHAVILKNVVHEEHRHQAVLMKNVNIGDETLTFQVVSLFIVWKTLNVQQGSRLKVDYEVTWDKDGFFQYARNETQEKSSRMLPSGVGNYRSEAPRHQSHFSRFSPDNVCSKRFKLCFLLVLRLWLQLCFVFMKFSMAFYSCYLFLSNAGSNIKERKEEEVDRTNSMKRAFFFFVCHCSIKGGILMIMSLARWNQIIGDGIDGVG